MSAKPNPLSEFQTQLLAEQCARYEETAEWMRELRDIGDRWSKALAQLMKDYS